MNQKRMSKLLKLKKDDLKALADKLKLKLPLRLNKEDMVEYITKAEESVKRKREAMKKKREQREQLMKKKKDELLDIAKKLGGAPAKAMTKADLTETIEKLQAKFKRGKKSMSPDEKKNPVNPVKKVNKVKNDKTPAVVKKVAAKKKPTGKSKTVNKIVQKVGDIITKSPTAPLSNGKGNLKEQVESARYSTIPKTHEIKGGARREPDKQVKLSDENLPFPQWEGATMLYLLPRDERWVFATWEIDWQTREGIVGKTKSYALELHLLDFGPGFEPYEKPVIKNIALNENTDNWFINTGTENHVFIAELGYVVDGEFRLLARSNRIVTASASESKDTTAYFISIPPDMPLMAIRKMLKGIGADIRKLAIELHRLDMASPPPENYPGIDEKKAEITKRLRELMHGLPSSGSISSYMKTVNDDKK